MKKKINKKVFLSSATLIMSLLSCASKEDKVQDSNPEESEQDQMIETMDFQNNRLFPEGLDFSISDNSFYLTSLTEGKVSRLNTEGSLSTVFEDENLISAIGIRIDQERNRVIVLSSDPGVSAKRNPEQSPFKVAGAFVFSLEDSSLISYIDFTSLFEDVENTSFFANDIALAEDGTFYVSDSKSSSIYKVDPEYNASIFVADERFMTNMDNFNLNGIVVNSEFLFTLNADSGKLFRISLSDNSIMEVDSQGFSFTNGDGLILKDHDLYAIKNTDSHLSKLVFSEDFSSVSSLLTRDLKIDGMGSYPTTGFLADDSVYVLNSHLDILFSGQDFPTFSISKVSFD